MNEEIKELIKECNELLNDEFFTLDNIDITRHELILLLDYITNLQQQLHQASLDIQELTERDIECPSWCDKLTNLQQENERLKLELSGYREAILRDDKLLGLQQRIEKAVEYIEKCQLGVDSMDRPVMLANEDEGKILLDILNGKE